MSQPFSSKRLISSSSDRGYLSRSSFSPNCIGLTKIVDKTILAFFFASTTNAS